MESENIMNILRCIANIDEHSTFKRSQHKDRSALPNQPLLI